MQHCCSLLRTKEICTMLKTMFVGNKISFNIIQHRPAWWPKECNMLNPTMLNNVASARELYKKRKDSKDNKFNTGNNLDFALDYERIFVLILIYGYVPLRFLQTFTLLETDDVRGQLFPHFFRAPFLFIFGQFCSEKLCP